MNKLILKIITYLFYKSNAIKQGVFALMSYDLKNNQFDFNLFLRSFPELYEEADKYPSVFNDGYKHIDKAIELARFFNLPSENLVLDVGAASGITSIRFSKAFPSSVIYAFEPIPDTFQILKRETAGYPAIEIINKALGNEIKSLNIHLAARVTSSSLLDIEKNLTNEFWKKNLKEEGTIQVQMSKLDVDIPQEKNVSILKMDVQGYELEVLKGGVETLNRTAIVLVEMQNHDLYIGAPKYYQIDEFMRNNNFELYNMIPSIRQDEKIYEWDAIYVNKNIQR
ncbi:MAG: FkbM family methyltransferase [Bacteroidetes bacterium]|nr:FkbM family methyltransferase [Bacteroidota bacterium]